MIVGLFILLLSSSIVQTAPVFRKLGSIELPFFYPSSVAGELTSQPSNFLELTDLELAQAACLESIGASSSGTDC
jgi:hypothetical protein